MDIYYYECFNYPIQKQETISGKSISENKIRNLANDAN